MRPLRSKRAERKTTLTVKAIEDLALTGATWFYNGCGYKSFNELTADERAAVNDYWMQNINELIHKARQEYSFIPGAMPFAHYFFVKHPGSLTKAISDYELQEDNDSMEREKAAEIELDAEFERLENEQKL